MSMVEIWFCREGPSPTCGHSVYSISVDDAVNKLGLQPRQFIDGPNGKVRFNEKNALGAVCGNQHVVAEVTEADDARELKPGYYDLEMSPQQAIDLIGYEPKDPRRLEP